MGTRLTTTLVIAFVLVCVAVDFYPTSLPPPFPYEVEESVFDKVEDVNFSPAEREAIRKELRRLFSPPCTVAFSNAGLRSPLKVVTDEGVVLRPSIDLYKYTAEELGLVSDATRRAYWKEFSSCNAQGGTVSARFYGVRLTTDGRARVFLHDTAFQGEWLLLRKLSLHDVLVHEFMHVGGLRPTPGWFFQHDLAGFEFYDEIMEACR
jgi:hypothetical protein